MMLAGEEEQLIELQRFAALGKMLANVAHEFSTPAAALASNTELELRLLDQLDTATAGQTEGRVRDLLVMLRNLVTVDQVACGRIRSVVKGLKTAARARGSEFQRVDVNELAESMAQLAKTEFRAGVEFNMDFGVLPAVECDPSLLAQALLNLLTNAGHAIEGSGSVTVGTRAEGDRVHIWIADTGRGIREEDKPKVLRQPFTTKAIGVGTGLGLAIVSDVVNRVHQGTVEFESEYGKGSTFHLRIPVDHKEQGV